MGLGVVGLGSIGKNLVRHLTVVGHQCVVYDIHSVSVQMLTDVGDVGMNTFEDFISNVTKPRAIWMMAPAAGVDDALAAALPYLEHEDLVIYAGDTRNGAGITRSEQIKARGVHYVDMGTSGHADEIEPLYCLVNSGESPFSKSLDCVFPTGKPNIGSAAHLPGREKQGGAETPRNRLGGPSKQFAKMVDSRIESGLMAAYTQGMTILHQASGGSHEREADIEVTPRRYSELYENDSKLADVDEVWHNGCVVSSWLVDIAASATPESPVAGKFTVQISDSEEGRWTVIAAIYESVPAPVITAALYERFNLKSEAGIGANVLSALRSRFGLHVEDANARRATG